MRPKIGEILTVHRFSGRTVGTPAANPHGCWLGALSGHSIYIHIKRLRKEKGFHACHHHAHPNTKDV
jgi:hypothetical protein